MDSGLIYIVDFFVDLSTHEFHHESLLFDLDLTGAVKLVDTVQVNYFHLYFVADVVHSECGSGDPYLKPAEDVFESRNKSPRSAMISMTTAIASPSAVKRLPM